MLLMIRFQNRDTMSHLRYGLIWTAVFFVMNDVTAVDEKPQQFRISTKRETDAVEVQSEKDKTVFAVNSPFGIGQAVIEKTGEKWPAAVVVRLHLKGLEGFRASNGQVQLEAAASSQNEKSPIRLWKDGKEDEPLDSKSPYWMEIRIIRGSRTGAATHFEMQLPRAFLEDQPKSITLRWIDFYRS